MTPLAIGEVFGPFVLPPAPLASGEVLKQSALPPSPKGEVYVPFAFFGRFSLNKILLYSEFLPSAHERKKSVPLRLLLP